MKRFLVILLAVVLTILPTEAAGRKVTVSFKNEKAEKVLSVLKKQTGYQFACRKDLMESVHAPITCKFNNADVDEVLQTVIEDKMGLSYDIVDGTVIISRPSVTKKKNTVSDIKGKVVDENGEPLPGVTVMLANSTTGTATDADGTFTLSNIPSEGSLNVSYVGYEPLAVKLGGRRNFDIQMRPVQNDLSDVVVTGYQTIEKGRATGAFNVLKGSDLDEIYSTDIRKKLEGAAPGVYVSAGNKIEIRGVTSLNADTEPLIVVDGIPMEGSALNLNPNDVSQISVLKDAASASVWGIRAANGVIVITTKRGSRTNRPEVHYQGNVSVTGRPSFDDLHILGSGDYASLLYEQYRNTGVVTTGKWGSYNELQEIYLQEKSGDITAAQAEGMVARIGSFDNRRQLEKLFYQRPLTVQNNITVKSGGENSSTFLSVNYDYSRNARKGDDAHKVNLLVNNDFKLSSRLSLQSSVRGTLQKSHVNSVDVSTYMPWQRVLNDDGTYYEQYNTGNYYPAVNPSYKHVCESLGMKRWNYNALEELRDNDNKATQMNIVAMMALSWYPVDGLTLTSWGSYEYGRTELENLYSENHYFTRNLVNTFTEATLGEDGFPESIGEHHIPVSGGIKDMTIGRIRSYVWRNSAEYNRTFGEFDVKAIVGNEIYSREGNSSYSRQWGYNSDMLTLQTIDEASLQSGVKAYNGRTESLNWAPTIGETLERYVSYYSTASLGYSSRYNLFGSVRLDKTNLLTNSSKYRNNPSWSVGAKWNLNDEPWLAFPWLSMLNLRASYGLSGNIDKSTGPDIVVASANDSYLKLLNILYITNPSNPRLGWEKTHSFNLGLDFAFLNHRVSGSLDFYNKRSLDLLASVQSLDPTTGWASFYKNSATMINRGIDLTLNGSLIQTKDLMWTMTLNFSFNHNNVTKLLDRPTATTVYSYGAPVEGYPANSLFAIRYGGLNDAGEPTFFKKGENTPCEYGELSTLTVEDLEYMGRTTPPVFGSLQTALKFKDFTLSAMLSYKFGHKFRLPSTVSRTLYTEWMGSDYRWKEGADNTGKWVPKLFTESSVAPMNYTNCLTYSDRLVAPADIVRLRSLSVSYDLSRWLRLINMRDGNIQVAAENLCSWKSNSLGIDPDYVNNFSVKPSFIVSLNLGF